MLTTPALEEHFSATGTCTGISSANPPHLSNPPMLWQETCLTPQERAMRERPPHPWTPIVPSVPLAQAMPAKRLWAPGVATPTRWVVPRTVRGPGKTRQRRLANKDLVARARRMRNFGPFSK